MDFEEAARNYRLLPLRPKGRPAATEAAASQSRRRITIFPFHPCTLVSDRTDGTVGWVPASIQDILITAREQFGKDGTKVLNQDGGQIRSTDFIMDGDRVYVVGDNDPLSGRSKSES